MLDTDLLQGYLAQLPQAVVEQMLALYQAQAETYLQNIANAAADGQQQDWQNCCHKMKGAAASMGFIDLQQRLAEAEKLLLTDLDSSIWLQQTKQLNQNSIAALVHWLAANS